MKSKMNLRRYTVTIVTMAIVSALLSFYFMFYVSKNDREIRERNFRVLNRTVKNIKTRAVDYQKYFSSISPVIIDSIKNAKDTLDPVSRIKKIENNIGGKADNVFRGNKTDTPTHIKPLSLISDMDSAYLKIRIVIDESDTLISNIPDTVVYYVGVNKFLVPILREDAFHHYALIKDRDILYKDFPQEFIIDRFDSLFKKGNRFKTNSIITSEFAGRNYTMYVSPFEFAGENNFALVGITETEKINSEKYAVPGSFIIVVLSVIFFVLLSLPLIKTVLMSENERLKVTDVLSSFLCFMIGFGLLLFIFVHLFATNFIDKERYDSQQAGLASSIKKSFRNDLLTTFAQLKVYDSLVEYFPCNITDLDDSLSQAECQFKCVIPDYDKAILHPAISSSFKYVFWLDDKANEIIKWTTDVKLSGKTNYKERQYFQQIKNQTAWQLPDSGKDAFVMQPVFSWTDGRFRAVVAKESSRKILADSLPKHIRDIILPDHFRNVTTQESFRKIHADSLSKYSTPAILAGISSRFHSVINTVLPSGFSYCIINQDGETWFHSDTRKNLNENFIEECSSPLVLSASMYSQKAEFIDMRYSGINSRVHISPVEGLPLFLAVIRNTEPESTKNVQTFLITMGLSVSLVLVFVLLLVFYILLRLRHSKLRKNFLEVNWLFPSEKSNSYYHMTIFLNVVVTIVSYLVTSAEHPVFTFYVFVSNILVSISSFYFIGIRESYWYYRERDKRNFLIVLIIFILLLLVSAFKYLTPLFSLYLVLYLIYCLFSAFILFNDNTVLPSAIRNITEKIISPFSHIKISYKKVYSLMIFCWLMHVIFVPVIRFYQIADNYESKNLLKYDQLSTALRVSALMTRPDAGNEKFSLKNSAFELVHNVYLNPGSTLLLKDSCRYKDTIRTREEESFEKKQFTEVIKRFHVMFSQRAAYQEEFYSLQPGDTSMQWVVCGQNLFFKYTNKIKKSGTDDTLYLSSVLPSSINPFLPFPRDLIATFGYLLLLFLLVRLLYNCVHFFVNKFFLINYFENKKLEQTNPLFMDESDLESTENARSKIILISLPNSGKRNYLDKIISRKGNQNDKIDIDLALIDTSCWEAEKNKTTDLTPRSTLILHHFEYKISETAANTIKLEFIESLFRKQLQNIILLTTVHPRAFLSMMKKDVSASDISDVASENNYYRWALLLSSFKITYYPVVRNSDPKEEEITDILSLIKHECSYGDFLKKLEPSLTIYAESQANILQIDALAEGSVLMIQHQAEAYYLSVWHSLTRDEQYVLYDIAEDELSNYKNREALTMLYNKGLLVHEGRLKIMNLSFKNFILTVVKPESKVINDMERAKGSNFNKFKVPFFIIFIATMFFIFFTQEETFNKLIAIIASFTASLPLVLRLFSLVPGVKGVKAE